MGRKDIRHHETKKTQEERQESQCFGNPGTTAGSRGNQEKENRNSKKKNRLSDTT